jgi:hypothetical protein
VKNQQNEPAFRPLNGEQYEKIARWAKKEIRGDPSYGAWSEAQRAQAEAEHLRKLAFDPHCWRRRGRVELV